MPTLTKFQCSHCLHILGLPDKLAGRKIRCPMCGEPLVIPAPDPAREFRKQDLKTAIGKFEISDWDRAFAATVLERGKVEKKILYKALVALIKSAKKGTEVGLGEELKRAGAIDQAECDLIRDLVRGSVSTEKEKFVECPNCFANISTKARSCKFCGQAMGDVSVAICPNCKHEQASTAQRCSRCMADMKTGLRTGVRICHGCNRPVMGNPEHCPHCKAELREPTRRKRVKSRRAFRIKVAVAAAAVLLLLGVFLYRPVHLLFRCASVGYGQAVLEERLRGFAAALRRNSLDSIEEFVADDAKLEIDRETRTRVLLGAIRDKRVSRVLAITIKSVELKNDGKSALVRVHAVLRVADRSMEEATRNVFSTGRKKEIQTVWTWIRRKGEWYYMRTE